MITKKKITILSILIALILVVTTTSITYAIWSSKHVTESNIVQSGCLNIEYKNLSDAIDIRRVGPGYNDGRYVFSITNTCNTAINYQVNLETLEGSTLDSSYIYLDMYGDNLSDLKPSTVDAYDEYYANNQLENFFNNEMILSELEEVTPTLNNAIKAHKIYSYTIKSYETHVYDLYTDLVYNLEDNEGEESEWYSKVTVISVPQKQIKVTLDPDGGTLDNRNLYYIEGDTYSDLPEPTKEGYIFDSWVYNDSIRVRDNEPLQAEYNHTLKAKYLNANEVSLLTPYAFNHISENIPKNMTDYSSLCIDKIIPYDGTPSDDILEQASIISEAGLPTYTWVNNRILYYWSSAEKIMMQRDKFFGNDTGDTKSLYKTLKELDLSRIDTSLVTNMSYMFDGLWELERLDISSFDTSNVTDMNNMFVGCHGLTTLDLSNFNTSKVTDMNKMFWWNYGLTSLNISSFDTSNVTNMENMFYEIPYLTSLDVSNFNTTNVTNMNYMFGKLNSIETLDLSNFNTTNLKEMIGMFKDNTNLKTLNLSGFDLTNVEHMESMFKNTPLLTTVTFNGKVYDHVNDDEMLCGACDNIEITGYTPTVKATRCGL